MSEQDARVNTCGDAAKDDLEERLRRMLSEVDGKLEVEAIVQLVEQYGFGERLNRHLQQALGGLRQSLQLQGSTFGATQALLRELIMDVALVKRALASLGQVGVMERRRIEKELVLELFPPTQPHPGAGVSVAVVGNGKAKVDCRDRLPICRAACCRNWHVVLTAAEIQEGRLDWNPRMPYVLHKNRLGCVHLKPADCSCAIYDCRPNVCTSYSCKNDKRIWADYEKKILNPELRKHLEPLVREHREQGILPSNGNGDLASEATPDEVAPPDFSRLREMIVPEPARQFVPSNTQEGESGDTADLPDDGRMDEGEC